MVDTVTVQQWSSEAKVTPVPQSYTGTSQVQRLPVADRTKPSQSEAKDASHYREPSRDPQTLLVPLPRGCET